MSKLINISDNELVMRLSIGSDQEAFIEIYNRYHAPLYSAALKRSISAEAAEEIVQDLFIVLWTRRQQLSVHSSLSGYLFTSVRNMILNQIQKESVRTKFNQSLKLYSKDYDNSTMEIMMAKEMGLNIDKTLLRLPAKCRSVFELSRKQHKTNKEIAQELGISEKTVENHMTRAIRFLRLSLHFCILTVMILFINYKSKL